MMPQSSEPMDILQGWAADTSLRAESDSSAQSMDVNDSVSPVGGANRGWQVLEVSQENFPGPRWCTRVAITG